MNKVSSVGGDQIQPAVTVHIGRSHKGRTECHRQDVIGAKPGAGVGKNADVIIAVINAVIDGDEVGITVMVEVGGDHAGGAGAQVKRVEYLKAGSAVRKHA